MAPSERVVAVVGPTAVGKTSLAEALAARLSGEIVSCDSMQIYRGMDIGTAKPATAARTVKYHCIDLVDPGEPYSAALFQRDARDAIADILGRGGLPVLSGGTGLYVRAALDDWDFPRGHAATLRRVALDERAAALGPDRLHALLAERDPEAARLIHPNNVRRVIRALEMLDEGVSYAEQASRFSLRTSLFDTTLIGLSMERGLLYSRIESRVDGMLAAGLLAEVSALLARGYRDALTASQAIGYKELVPVVEGEADLAEAVGAIKRSTRRYAKRQLTWFRADPRIMWIDVTELSPADVLSRALALIESAQRW